MVHQATSEMSGGRGQGSSNDLLINVDHSRSLLPFGNATRSEVPPSTLLKTCSDWYAGFIRSQIHALYSQARPNLSEIVKLPPTSLETRDESQVVTAIFELLRLVASSIASTQDVTIEKIAKDLLRKEAISDEPDQSSKRCQLSFILMGWITMLYKPVLNPRANMLEIDLPEGREGFRNRRRMQNNFVREIQVDNSSLPFRHLYAYFGDLFPHPLVKEQNAGASRVASYSLYADLLIVSNLHYYSLTWVGKIKIDWVDSLSLHMEFDAKRQQLKLFRFPTYCCLICSSPENVTFLDQLFLDYFSDPIATSGNEMNAALAPEDFFREILWSYGMIFGQHKASWEAFQANWNKQPNLFKNGKSRVHGLKPIDPLLLDLCGGDWCTCDIYDQLSAPPAKAIYSAYEDFPFLGKRMLRLQDYMNAQNPSDLRTLYYDRRDVLRFYTFWAVLVVGGLSILLSFAQLLVSAAQIVVGVKVS